MRFRIGDCLVKPDMSDLVRNGHSIHVSPKAMEVLLFLAQRQGQVVPKEELFEKLWNGVFVTDDALTRCIGELRRAFQDDPRCPWLIQTIAKRGYMLLPPVGWESDDACLSTSGAAKPYVAEPLLGHPPDAHRKVSHQRALLFVAVTLAVLALSLAAFHGKRSPRPQAPSPKPRLAVLPLVNLSDDPQQEYFADGMTEQLITELARIDAWEVISRTTVMSYKGTKQTLPEVARSLSADWIMEGTVQRSSDHVRITAQLIDAKSDRHLWSGSFDSKLSDMLTLESDFARTIATELKFSPNTYPKPRQRERTVVPAAYESYLKGRYFYNQSHYPEAASYFEQATLQDPNFALAQAMLWEADAMSTFGSDNGPPPRALRAARRAIELDDSLAEAHLVNGDLEFYGEWDFAAGEAEFRRAVQLNPGSTDAIAHYAGCLHVLRQWDQSIFEYRRALHMDPASPQLNRWFFEVLANSGRYQEALEQFQKTVELNPADGSAYLRAGDMFHLQARDDEALAAYLKAETLFGTDQNSLHALRTAGNEGGYVAYWRKRIELNEQMSGKTKRSSIGLAAMFVRAREYDKAMDLLEAAYAKHSPSLVWIGATTVWQPLRDEPRYQSLLSRMRLSGEDSTGGPDHR